MNMNEGLVTVNNGEYSIMAERTDDNFVAQLTDDKNVSFCSMSVNTQEEKIKLFNAMNNPEKSIKECVNMELKIKDVFVEVVQCVNELGEVKDCPRIVLIDEKGVGYTAVSLGVFSSLKKIFQVFGFPTWEKPISIVPKVISKGQKQITTLSIK